MARSRTPRGDYKVGYKKPPKHTQFKPGQSGNPRGRPKKTREPALPAGLSQESARILSLLEEEVSVVVDGRARRVTRGESIQRALLEQAMAGDFRALKYTIEQKGRALAEKTAIEAALGREQSIALTLDLLEALRAQELEEAGSPPGEQPGAAGDVSQDAPDDAECGEDLERGRAAGEAGDRYAGTVGEWRDDAPHSSLPSPPDQPSAPEQPSAGVGGPPPRDAVGGMHWGNASPPPQPPRVRGARRASSSELLIKSTGPHTRSY